jgi:citrate synthase
VDKVDQRRFDNQLSETMDARAAAQLLGVKLRTLYAYASRGWLTSLPAEGTRRRYRRDEILRMKARHDARAGHGAVAAGALRWGEPVLESALTRIDPKEGPMYRGRAAVALAEADVGFEAAAELLWTGALPSEPPRWRADGLGLPASRLTAILPRDPSEAPLLGVLQLACASLAMRDPFSGGILLATGSSEAARFASPTRFAAPPELELQRARALVLRLTACLAVPETWHHRRGEPEASRVAPRRLGRRGGPVEVEGALQAASVTRALLTALGGPGSTEAVRAVDRAPARALG